MQLAMTAINQQNRLEDLPEIEMGIGVHTGQVVVGNIGSPERMKYGVVGSHVNLTSRIQSCTTGGQILVSETTRQEVGPILKTGKQMEVKAKGVEHPITLYEVLGIGGKHKLLITEAAEPLVPLAEEIPLRYEVVEGAQLGGEMAKGWLTKISCKAAEARLENPVPPLSNLKMRLLGPDGKELPGTLYGKVLDRSQSSENFCIRFTSVSPEIATVIRAKIEAPETGINPSGLEIAAPVSTSKKPA
jgi:adenylate cyclase